MIKAIVHVTYVNQMILHSTQNKINDIPDIVKRNLWMNNFNVQYAEMVANLLQ